MPRKKKFKAPPPVEYSNEPIITTEVLANYFDCSIDNIRVNFNRNKERFVEDKHYFKLEGEALKNFKDSVTDSYVVGKNANILYLWTLRGASRHTKILNTEKAWEVFEKLKEFYFDHEKFSWNKLRSDGKLTNKNFKDVMKKLPYK